jgi:exosome complex component RRP42
MRKATKEHVIASLDAGVRLDGRKMDEYRDVQVTYDVAKTAEGSAQVQIGDTIVIAGIKLSIETPYADTPNVGTMMVNAELLPLSGRRFEMGPPGIEAIELSRVVDRGIRESKAVDVKKLCITKGEKVWGVSADICTLNDAGNLFDASGLAVIAALKTAEFPSYDGVELNYKKKSGEKVPLNKIPIALTVVKVGKHLLVDPLPEEMACCDARLTITTTTEGNICSLQKGGDATLSIEEIGKMIDMSLKYGEMLRSKL